MKSSVPGSAPRAWVRACSRVYSRVNKRPVYRIIIAQSFAMILATVVCLFFGWVTAGSVFLGGLVCVVPNLVLAGCLREAPGQGMRQLLYGEFGKFGLTVLMFGTTFVLVKPLNILLFFGTFIGLQVLVILVPLWDAYRQAYRHG